MIYLTVLQTSLYILGIGFIVFLILLIRNQIDDYKCKKSIMLNSHTFYQAFSKIKSTRKRKAIYAVYDFCRYADDLVDEYQDEKGLLKLEDDLVKHVSGIYVHSYRFRALKRHTYRLYDKDDYQAFFDMIKGQKMDLAGRDYQTLDDLLKYCYCVAGSVGIMLLPILSFNHKKELKVFAIHLGYAMQITNILRDVGEDYQKGRIYLPKEMMEENKYSLDDLKQSVINDQFKALFESLASIAEKHFDDALNQIDLLEEDSRKPLAYAIILYRGILDACRKSNYDVFTKKNYVDEQQKSMLIKAYVEKHKEKQA